MTVFSSNKCVYVMITLLQITLPKMKLFFKKMGRSRPLFSLFSSFQYTVDSKQMFNI